jgi:hypothetical protein
MVHVLRVLVAGLGALLLAVGILGPASMGEPIWTGLYFIVLGAGAIAISVIAEPRYWPGRGKPSQSLRPTGERFIDPSTGEATRVWIDPGTGERSYQPDEDAPQK